MLMAWLVSLVFRQHMLMVMLVRPISLPFEELILSAWLICLGMGIRALGFQSFLRETFRQVGFMEGFSQRYLFLSGEAFRSCPGICRLIGFRQSLLPMTVGDPVNVSRFSGLLLLVPGLDTAIYHVLQPRLFSEMGVYGNIHLFVTVLDKAFLQKQIQSKLHGLIHPFSLYLGKQFFLSAGIILHALYRKNPIKEIQLISQRGIHFNCDRADRERRSRNSPTCTQHCNSCRGTGRCRLSAEGAANPKDMTL